MQNSGQNPLPSALFLILLFIVFASAPVLTDMLRYQREAISSGQFWRLFTGHFVHLNMAHALLNSSGTLLLAFFLAKDIQTKDWWVITLIAPLVISAGLWWREPELVSYAGFSGVLHGLLYYVVIRLIPEMPFVASSVLLLLVSRQLWEQTSAYNPEYLRMLIHGRVMPDAHLFGAITGSLWAVWATWRDRRLKSLDKAADLS